MVNRTNMYYTCKHIHIHACTHTHTQLFWLEEKPYTPITKPKYFLIITYEQFIITKDFCVLLYALLFKHHINQVSIHSVMCAGDVLWVYNQIWAEETLAMILTISWACDMAWRQFASVVISKEVLSMQSITAETLKKWYK